MSVKQTPFHVTASGAGRVAPPLIRSLPTGASRLGDCQTTIQGKAGMRKHQESREQKQIQPHRQLSDFPPVSLPYVCSTLSVRDEVCMAAGCAAHTLELTDRGQHVWRMSHAAWPELSGTSGTTQLPLRSK